MLLQIARFEARYVLRNPLLLATALAAFLFVGAGLSVDGFDLGNEGGLLKNAAYATLRNYAVLSVVFMLVTTSFVATAVLRDDETGFGPIVRSTGITRADYLFGRFAGAFAAAALALLVLPLAILVGPLMPWTPAEQVGPARLADHLYGYLLVALPNLFVHGALLFALATFTRSLLAAYLGVVGFVAAFFLLQTGFVGEIAVAIAEPFGGRALRDMVRYWTVAERNARLPAVTGAFLYNRLLWVGLGVLALALVGVAYRFADQRMTRRERRRLQRSRDVPAQATRRAGAAVVLPAPQHGPRALRALLWMRTRFEVRQVVRSPAFVVLMAWGTFTTAYALTTRDTPGRPSVPTTLTLLPDIRDAFAVILLVVAILYAGELVWRERDRRVHELVDTTPLPNWGYVVPKTLAMALVLATMLVANVGAAMLFQLAHGHTDVEPGKYLLWYLLPAAWDALLLAALAVFVQALSPHKTIAWAIMVAFVVWRQFNQVVDHDLLNFGASPGMPLSDLDGAGTFWIGAWTVRLYWGAFAVLLLVGAHLLWRRGTETRLRPRLATARQRLTGAPGWIAAAALVVLAGTGGWSYYNMNVLNAYRAPLAALARQAELERTYGRYAGLPQPTVARMTLDVALHPAERRAVTRGRWRLRNETPGPIAEVHVRLLDDALELVRASVAGARHVVDDRALAYHVFHLDVPMRPGEERELSFETRRWHRGFRNGAPDTRLVENGTFLAAEHLVPVLGMGREGTLEDAAARRRFGLPARGGRPRLEDTAATAHATLGRGWTTTDITVSTTADQTPLAPGRRVSDEVRGGRRVARFVSEAPVRQSFAVQSARYAERRRTHAGVELAVYYHPAHGRNVDRMLDALAASLDHYRTAFGPYPFDHARIVEYPGWANFAQAFPGTVAYSETYGFTADLRDPATLDHVTATTAHELAHQWWGHQVTGADVEGSMVLSETLANYSALMMLKRLGDEAELRGALAYLRDRYLAWRSTGGVAEPPLMRVETETWIGYHKGALAMYLLQARMGEARVNRALRTFLERYRFRGAPYPRSLDLVAALRAEARTAEEQALITDLFERVVLYDLQVRAPTAVRRADGRWDVAVPIAARKLLVDARGAEHETPFAERIDVGLFTAEPGSAAFRAPNVLVAERRPIRQGVQVLRFVTARRPTHAGVDPHHHLIDRRSGDNVGRVAGPD